MIEDTTWAEKTAQALGISVDRMNLIESYLLHVIEANKTTNLTRIETLESGRMLHLEDSLSGLKEFNKAPEGLYGDLGTGGGFPGVPLSIATGRTVLLVDSVKKKVAILEDIVREMGLSKQMSTYGGRIEDLATEKKASFSVLTARALSSLSSLLELSSPLLVQGGQLICYKANVEDEEIDHVEELKGLLAMRLVSDRSFTLSDGVTPRRILVFEKKGYPSIKLPRRMGMAQKRPL